MPVDLAVLSYPLPEDIEKLKYFGDFEGALEAIQFLLSKELPLALKKRLMLECEMIQVMQRSEYPYDVAAAQALLKETFENYEEKELIILKEQGKVDWIYTQGQVYFQRRFLENLLKTQPEYQKRVHFNTEEKAQQRKKQLLSENIQRMKKQGKRTAQIHLKTSIKIKKECEKVGERVLVHLPIPKECQQMTEIEILKTIPEATLIAPEQSEQRTVAFETTLEPDQLFSVEYSYKNSLRYVELSPDSALSVQPDFELNEQAPHILFTPYLKAILQEIIGQEQNPVLKAWKIYEFVTTNVHYSFMREYFTLPNISEYAAVNLKGDCGVQAILFITLCRMAGIPAKWQSGLYVTPDYTGCHDWAQFYIAPYGWVFADLSFGGSAYKAGDVERWHYYFGNLDCFRMIANSEIQSEFYPPKMWRRADPIDNQKGEFEFLDHGLVYAELEMKQELVSLEFLEESH